MTKVLPDFIDSGQRVHHHHPLLGHGHDVRGEDELAETLEWGRMGWLDGCHSGSQQQRETAADGIILLSCYYHVIIGLAVS